MKTNIKEILKFKNKTQPSIGIIILLLVICIVPRFLLSFYNNQANDNHIDPISLWIENGDFPAVADCDECFQPSLFYGLVKTAVVLRTEKATKKVIISTFQWVNFVLSVLILFLIFYIHLSFDISLWLKYLLSLFWGMNPKLIAICGQMTNDAPIILLGLLFTICLVKWNRQRGQTKWLFCLLAIGTIAPLVKGSGLVLFGFLGLIALAIMVSRRKKGFKNALILSGALLVCSVFIWFAGGYHSKYITYGTPFKINREQQHSPNFVTRDTMCKERLGVTTVVESYFTFRIIDLVENPFLENSYDLKPLHRSSFFTLLYGQFSNAIYEQHPFLWKNKDPVALNFARVNYIVHLPLLLIFVVGFLASIQKWVRGKAMNTAAIHALIFSIFLLFVLKYSYDFRDFSFIKLIFIFPALQAMIYFFKEGAIKTSGKPIFLKMISFILVGAIVFYAINLGFLISVIIRNAS